jgi:hypothetical protein
MANTKVTVDTTEAERELDQLQRHTVLVANQTLSTVRKGYTSISLFMEIIGQSVNLALDMLIQSMLMYAESFTLFATAESVVGSPRAILLFSMATMMFYRAVMMRGEADRFTKAFDAGMRIGSLWL